MSRRVFTSDWFTKRIKALRKRDWLPWAAGLGLGLSLGDKLTIWVLKQRLSEQQVVHLWNSIPAMEWISRIAIGLLFLAIAALMTRTLS